MVNPKKSKKKRATGGTSSGTPKSPSAKYPRHSVDKSLRIPQAILEQNAGKECTVKESAAFLGVGAAGPYTVEVSSGIKYGFLERPSAGRVAITSRDGTLYLPGDLVTGFAGFDSGNDNILWELTHNSTQIALCYEDVSAGGFVLATAQGEETDLGNLGNLALDVTVDSSIVMAIDEDGALYASNGIDTGTPSLP